MGVTVGWIMPSKTIHFRDDQYVEISSSTDEHTSFSERVRELIDKGIKVEQDE